MFLIFFVIFLVTPILEILLFIEIGGLIGTVPTILIVIVTAIVGSILLRLQGSAVLQRTQQSLRAGEVPVDPVIDGISLLLAGALLLTPGFFTDTVGFLLFVPPLRRAIAKRIFKHMMQSGNVFVVDGSESEPPRGPRNGDDRRSRPGDETIIDVDYQSVDEDSREDDRPQDDDERRDKEPPRWRGSSPWRQ